MNNFVLIAGATFGCLAVILGAFGAHALKKVLSQDLLKSFETGVKYQMYHALVLLFLGSALNFDSTIQKITAVCFILGTFLFSFSIYGLCLTAAKGNKIRILGPVTPLGGLLLVAGWILLIVFFVDLLQN